jgi:hypothetical protein
MQYMSSKLTDWKQNTTPVKTEGSATTTAAATAAQPTGIRTPV